ncbi:hypothetical protein NLJ89_g5128 [Agrocybe chaxingu]|uniref:Ras GEF n=1 Tax=Agrocybe chaxingu TaxID=84603 RepID=A0A9W8K8R5_9AGAR|nr:hypothetical protein NLJ89_g5128 [Agrocybe chaxingu]
MASSTTTISSDFDDPLRSIPTIEAPESLLAVDQLDGPSLASTLKLPDGASQFLSPIPASTPPPPTFALSDLYDGTPEGLEALGPDIASADITVAADGTFLETSSGPAARELKRRYDQLAGVGLSVRSPYAITAFVNQHGKSMYRVGHRAEHSAPGKNAADVEDQINQSKSSTASQSPRTKRRSRLSMHFLPPAMFSKSSAPPPPPPAPPSRPPTAASSNTTTSRKLQRRTRSIPDLYSAATANGSTNGPTFSATGRAHSQSVTAADLPRPSLTYNPPSPERKFDTFAQLLDWFTPSSGASSNSSMFDARRSSLDPVRPRAAIAQPFGSSVSFNSPSQKPPAERQPPRHLRVMQSFESGLTARQDDLPASGSPVPEEEEESSRPPSAIRLSEIQLEPIEQPDTPVPEPDSTISAESLNLSSHYSTEVFNVLQTYRGLPLFETLADEDTTVIKLSFAADSSAAPRDDPRFVIWGEVYLEQDVDDYHSSSRDSLTDVSSSNPSSSFSKRRNSKVPKIKSPEASTSRLPPVEPGQRMLLAATIERWIAQLTSDLNYDELLNFFLTFRTYVSAVDLCHLLICRFHWACQKPSSLQDEKVRRIVRVRTFVAIRYWLLTFFTVDFIPNRELRLLIADWLNTLMHDPVLKKHPDGMDIVRRLVKVAKECKRAHTRTEAHTAEKLKPTSPPRSTPESPADHLLGKSFAEAIRKPVVEDTESDLDLDFLPDDAKPEEPSTGFPSDPANAHLTVGRSAGGVALTPSSRPSSLPLSSFNILQRTDHAPGPNADTDRPFVQNPVQVPLPNRHSALSRAFVRTIGRLGRWKRVLAPKTSVSRPVAPLGACAGVSAFDLEINASRDLLTMNGGVEQYLKMLDLPSAAPKLTAPTNASLTQVAMHTPLPSSPPQELPAPPLSQTSPLTVPANGESHSPQSPQSPASPLASHSKLPVESIRPPAVAEETSASIPQYSEPATQTADTADIAEPSDATACASDDSADGSTAVSDYEIEAFNNEVDRLRQPERAESFRSSSTDSFGQPLTSDGPLPPTFPGTHSQWQFDVVSIDDLDFSDTSSFLEAGEPQHPPGLRKPVRKLPMRRDFEFVRRSEVSSMGIVSHESMRDSINSSNHSTSPTSSAGGPQPIQKWQMKSLQQTFESMSNDGDDKGDVEAALLRLEGQINPKVLQEKAEKVDGWVRSLRERMANGDYDRASSIFSDDEPEFEGFIDEVDQPLKPDFETQPNLVVSIAEDEGYAGHDDIDDTVDTPMPTQTTHQLPNVPDLDRSKDAKPAVEDAVPLEILQSRVHSTEAPDTPLVDPSVETRLSSKFASTEAPRIHRSFILHHSAELLAKHFSMIDRELFMSVKFEELVTEEWMECEEIDVLDWAQYLKDRARWKVEGRFADKTTALAAVRARFNLMVSFVVAEIILTPPGERPLVVGKFIRIAWKSYSLSNFNTLTAIITALQTHWVSKAMRKPGWSRIGTFESRMYRDLKQFTTNIDHFKFMRQVVDSIVDAKPLESGSHASSVVSGGADSQSGRARAGSDLRPAVPSACIPFIGIYISQLHRLNKLPAVIDPTAPHSAVGIDPETAIFDTPAHPEVFATLAPLPPSMHLEPLINVHKQRRIADVIKSLVAGQHLASRVHFEVDKKLFQRCLRLRGLDSTYLQRALHMYPD